MPVLQQTFLNLYYIITLNISRGVTWETWGPYSNLHPKDSKLNCPSSCSLFCQQLTHSSHMLPEASCFNKSCRTVNITSYNLICDALAWHILSWNTHMLNSAKYMHFYRIFPVYTTVYNLEYWTNINVVSPPDLSRNIREEHILYSMAYKNINKASTFFCSAGSWITDNLNRA